MREAERGSGYVQHLSGEDECQARRRKPGISAKVVELKSMIEELDDNHAELVNRMPN